MEKRFRFTSLVISVILIASMLSGCSSKALDAAKQIESRMQERQEKANSFNNIDKADIDAQNAMDIIKELSSEKYMGRKTGTKENEAALKYIADQFRSMGLKNPEGLEDYAQYYNQPVTLLKDTPKLELLDKDGRVIKSFAYPKNFIFKVLSDSTEDIHIMAPIKVMENAAGLDKKTYRSDEVLLFSVKAQGRTGSTAIMSSIYDTNASAVIVEVDVDSDNSATSELIMNPLNRSWASRYKPVIAVDSATYAELAKASSEGLTVSIKCSYKFEKSARTANIVGYIPGTDERMKDEYIIIGGHMDHIGDNLNGTYNPGSLDNASGTAAMMEIARVISENDIKPKKTVVFIAFNGEEHGLIGSGYYTSNPVFPLKNAVMINLDMVGSSAILPLYVTTAPGQITDLKLELLGLARGLGIDAVDDVNANSDHTRFGDQDVPSVMLVHPDLKGGYHSPYDNLEDVNTDRLKQVIELVLYYIDKKAY